MKVTNNKNCTCHTCNKNFHYLGIARHRAAHRDKEEVCRITYTNGETYVYQYDLNNRIRPSGFIITGAEK